MNSSDKVPSNVAVELGIPRLAARQKRYHQWKEFLETPGLPSSLRSKLNQLLSLYGTLLVDFWKAPSEEIERKLCSLERELESVNDSIRVQTSQTLGREHDK